MNAFERQRVRDIAARNRQISKAVDNAMKDLSRRFTTAKGRRFASIMNRRLEALHDQILNLSEGGIRNQWQLSNKMNNNTIDGYLAGVKVSDALLTSYRSPNLSALNAFLDRTEAGMNLSDRIWQVTDGVRTEMQDLISSSVLEGKSAVRLSRELKGYIAGKPIKYEGKLIKGSNLNFQAIRVAASEMNMAFRKSDFLQNSKLPFVTGVTVRLSPAHQIEDICDEMAGEYPKGFEFIGWHPLCMCYATYNTLPKEEFVKYIETGEIDSKRFVKGVPGRAQRYLNKNGARLLGYENPPYWLDNFTKNLTLKKTVSGV